MLAGAAGWAQMYNEAPMLAAMVKAGELPPVDERLPSNPLVVEPFDSIGTYGGTVRMMDVADSMSIGLRVRHTGLFRYNQTASQFEADLAASHAWSNNKPHAHADAARRAALVGRRAVHHRRPDVQVGARDPQRGDPPARH